MGLQKSAAPEPTPVSSPNPTIPSSPTSSNKQKGSSGGGFSRSFSVYFPRSSAQVQPRPAEITELLRVVEELRENESRLKGELLKQKLLKESVALIPALEKEILNKDCEIEWCKKKIQCLEAENGSLRNESRFLHTELSRQNHRYEDKITHMQNELADIKRAVAEEASTSKKLVDVTNNYKSNSAAAKSLRRCVPQNSILGNFIEAGRSEHVIKNAVKKNFVGVAEENTEMQTSPGCNFVEIYETPDRFVSSKSRVPRIPKPPPRPSASPSSPFCSTISSSTPSTSCNNFLFDSTGQTITDSSFTPRSPLLTATAPPAPPPPPLRPKLALSPPPPPPPPARCQKTVTAMVNRVPEVVEFYHSLMRRDSNARRDRGGGGTGAPGTGTMSKDMIGEIENRSAYLLAIKTDIETQGDFINLLIKEVEGAVFTEIEDVVPFVKWLDDELSYLVDERAVLKHFDWPEKKADALREAAFGYCDLKKIESEVSSLRDDSKQPCGRFLKKMQSLFEKLEHAVYNLSRTRESASNRYKMFHIPTNWMLDTGIVSQIKLASVKLAMKYMKRVLAELEMVGGGPEEEELILRGVKFAFRVHQFAGGLDVATMKVFQELRNQSRSNVITGINRKV